MTQTKVAIPDEDIKQPPHYQPTDLEKFASDKIKTFFDNSSSYWLTKHGMQKRLWARYLNTKLQSKDGNFSNVQIGRTWYICDIIESILNGALLEQKPFGKVTGQGIEDFPGGQDMNEVNAWQQQQRYIKNTHRDSLLHSVVTGTGVKIPGWEYYIQTYFDRQENTTKLINPADPSNPIEIPTGEGGVVQKQEIIDRLSCLRIDEWLTFPPPGGTSPVKDPYLMFLVKFNRKQLKELEETGFIKNVDFIEDGAYGAKKEDQDIGDLFIDTAKKEQNSTELDRESIWLIYYFGLFKYSDDGTIPADGAEEPVFMIRPKYSEVMLKLDQNPYPAIPCVRDRYSGTDDEWYGRSFMEIVEKLLKLDEDMYGYVLDAAKRELFRRTFVPEGQDQSQLAEWKLDAIVEVPKTLFEKGTLPLTEQPRPQMMPNMQAQRQITSEIIDEISGVLDFVSGGDIEEQEKATMTNLRANFLNKRFKGRMSYYEDHGLHEWMEWQCVLNAMFLPDHVVEAITGTPAWLNPFKMIKPIMPMQSFDFVFEGSIKAAENPVQAQILRGLLDMSGSIEPGLDEEGNLVQINRMAIFRQLVRKTSPDEDLDQFFMPVLGFGGGDTTGASGGIGAVTPGDLAGNFGVPGGNAGIRPEVG